MRTRLATVFLVILGTVLAAQPRRLSPHEDTSTSVAGADISITYGRPYMRGRVIFGSLVPYGRVWCPGADEATTLATTGKMRIGDLALDPGRYTLWILPTADAWTLIVNKQTGQWHTQYNGSNDLGRVTMDKRELPAPVEQLTFSIDKAGGHDGYIRMKWEKTDVSVRFTVVE
jgi:hypothetical protein